MKNLLYTGALVLIVMPHVTMALFTDVSESHPNIDAISFAKEQGFVNGNPDGTFKPDTTINRAEFSKIASAIYWSHIPDETKTLSGESICAMLDDPPIAAKLLPFQDVSPDDWYAWSVCEARGYNIIDGYPDGSFRPSSPINFVEAAKMLVRAFQIPTEEGQIWYEPFVTVLDARGAIPDTIQINEHLITRGEMVEIIYRLYGYKADQSTNMTKLFLVAIGDRGKQGEKFGCDDSLVPIEIEHVSTKSMPGEALHDLLHLSDMCYQGEDCYGGDGLYNALYRSELSVDSISIETSGRANVYLTGELISGGACDDPRIYHQINATILQFPHITDVYVWINGYPLYEFEPQQ